MKFGQYQTKNSKDQCLQTNNKDFNQELPLKMRGSVPCSLSSENHLLKLLMQVALNGQLYIQPIYRDCWLLQAATAQVGKEMATAPRRPRNQRASFPQYPTQELIMEIALKLERDYSSVKALLEADQVKYSFVDHLVSIFARILLDYCPPVLKHELVFLTKEEIKEREKNWKPLIEKDQVRALLRLCDLFSSCKHQISNHSLRDIQKKDLIDIGFFYEDLQMIDNACGTCFNLDSRQFTEGKPSSINAGLEFESKVAPLVLCPSELSVNQRLYDQISSETLINCDLRFSIEQRPGKPPLPYVISGEMVRNSNQTASEFVKALLEQKGFSQHFTKLASVKAKTEAGKPITAQNLLDRLTKELEMKVIWVRYVTDKEKLQNAMRAYFQAAYLLETHGQSRLAEHARSNIFPKAFTDASLFISEYEQAFKHCTEERPINRALQIFRLRMNIQNSSLVKEMLKSFNVAQLRRENPRFVFDEKAATESIFVWKLTKQFSTIGFAIEQQLDGRLQFTQVCEDGPINRLFLQNTSLQEEIVSLIASFQQNLHFRSSQAFVLWEDIEQHFNRLRLALTACIKNIFFNPIIEATCHLTGEKHYYLKLHPRIFLGMMFAFKQKWLYEESVAANENPNFQQMEKLLIDWVKVYNKSNHVYYLKEKNGVFEPVKLDQQIKAQVINRILEAFTNSPSDLRVVLARQYSQQIQQSELITLFEQEILKLENAELVNPFFNNFMMIIGQMINQEPALVNRFLKVERKLEESKQEVSTFQVEEGEQRPEQADVQMQENQEPVLIKESEKDWDEDALLPRTLRRYILSVPNDKETHNKVILLLSFISVTQQGKSLVNDLGHELLRQVFTLSVDNRLVDSKLPLQVNFEYIVGMPHCLTQQKISPDHLAQLVERVPQISQTFKEIINKVVSLSNTEAKEILDLHFKEIQSLNGQATQRQRQHKYAGMKVKQNITYFSLMKKSAFLNALSQQQMHYEYIMRHNPHNDFMAAMINSPDEINRFLDLLEVLSMLSTKTTNKFLDLLKIIFQEQEHSIDKIKLLFARAKNACKRLQAFVGVPLSQVKSIDEIFEDRPSDQEKYIPLNMTISRHQQFECLVQILDFYAQAFQSIGQRAARKVGTYEKWDDVIETLMWSKTLLYSKQNEMLLKALNQDASIITNLADTSYYKALQENIEKKHTEATLLDESHAEFLENIQCIRAEIDLHLQKEYCQFLSKLEDGKLFQVISLTANQTMANPERQNSVNEVIRCNLKAIARVAAQIVHSLTFAKISFDDPQKLLSEIKRNDSLLTYLLKTFTDLGNVKGTFLCQFVAADGLIGVCQSYNSVKALCIRLQETRDHPDRRTFYIAERFALTSLVKLNQMLQPFVKLTKDNQAYQNPQQHMVADTEPRKYQNVPHFFANHYNQMLHLLVGFPDPKELERVFKEQIKVPEHCKSSIFMLLKELATGFSTIPQVGPPERNDRDAERDFFQRIMRENLRDFEGLGQFENEIFGGLNQNRRQPPQNRDPTQEEIETVTVMGYSPQEADAALRMANFDISQAIEVLLTNIEGVVAYSERQAKQKEEELRKKEQDEIEAALQKSLGLEEAKNSAVADELKTISHDEFGNKTKEYKQAIFECIIGSANIDHKNLSAQQQLTQMFVSKLIEGSEPDQKEQIAVAILNKAKLSYDNKNFALADTKALFELEFDLKLALVAVRDFNIHCKKKTAASCEFAISVAKSAQSKLADLSETYTAFKPTMGPEAFKTLNQDDKDKLVKEFSLRTIMQNALQLILHFIMVQSFKATSAIRKEQLNDKDLAIGNLQSKLLKKWEKQIRPDEVFELVKLILDEKQDLFSHCHKWDSLFVLVVATKLFSFPVVADIPSQKEKALQTLQLALRNKNCPNEKIIRNLLAISVYDNHKSYELSGQMVKKLLFASAIHRLNFTRNLKPDQTQLNKEIKTVETQLTRFKLASFMDQTQELYTVNPQNQIHDKAFNAKVAQLCQIFNSPEGPEVQIKQPILDEFFAQEKRQITEFERLILSVKQNEKQTTSLIKQAQDSVFNNSKNPSRQSIKVALNSAFEKLQYLNKLLTFSNQKQQFCNFTTVDEMELFIAEVQSNQSTVVDLLDKTAKFSQVYKFLMPKKAQTFASKLLENLHPLLWDVERIKDNPTQFRFRVTPKMVDQRQTFLLKFFNTFAGFSRLMTHEEQIVSYELRTKLLQQAVLTFAAIISYLQNQNKESTEFKSDHQARIKAITMLMVINCLIDSSDETIYHSSGCYRSSFITLLCRGKQKFIRQIASVVKITSHNSAKPVKEIVHQVDAKMEQPDDQEMSFCSINDSLQEADLQDDNDAQFQGFQEENEQLQGILVAQSIDCLTSIFTFIESEKQKISAARKLRAKQEEDSKPSEESKQPKVANQVMQVNEEMEDESDSSIVDESAANFGAQNEEMSSSQDDLIRQDIVEDEYDAEVEESEESEEDDENEFDDDPDDENMEEDESDDDDDDDGDEDIFVRRQQRRRHAEAAQDIINAPNFDQRGNDQGWALPIEDVGLQQRRFELNPRDQAPSENWSLEERQVQRTLALLRGIRPGANARVPPRNPLVRPSYYHPGLIPGEREDERAEQQSNRNQKPSKLSDLTSVFLPLDSKEVLSFINGCTSWLSTMRKKFVKVKDTSSSDQTIFRLIKEPKDPRSLFFARSRSALIEQIDSRLLDAELGFGRPFSFAGSFGQREDHENLLQRYERMLTERARLMNLQEALPSDRFGDGAPIRVDADVEQISQTRLMENYRALEAPARNFNIQTYQQALQREVEQVQPQQVPQRTTSLNTITKIEDQPNSGARPQENQFMELFSRSSVEQLSQEPSRQMLGIHNNPFSGVPDGTQSPNVLINAQIPERIQSPNVLINVQIPELILSSNLQSSSPMLIPLIQSIENQIPQQLASLQQSNEISQQSPLIVQAQSQESLQENADMQDEQQEQPVDQVVIAQANEEIQEEAKIDPVNQPVQEPMTCGIPNSVLIAHDIDPVILIDLPEDIQLSVLSEINWQPPAQQIQQQPEGQAQHEEAKQAQPSIEDQFGIDPGFLANLPPEMRQELLQNESLRNQNLGNSQSNPVQRQAEAMDVASIIQSAATPQLRAEMLANLDEATIATLPEGLRNEANAAQAAIRQRRNREGLEFDRLFRQAQQRAQHHNDRDGQRGRGVGRGAPRDGPGRYGAPRAQDPLDFRAPPRGSRFQMMMDQFMREGDNAQAALNFFAEIPQFKLEQALERYCAEDTQRIFEEPQSIEPQIIQMESQIVNEDLIVEGVLQLLLNNAISAASDDSQKTSSDLNEKANACKLIQFIQQMTSIKSQKGEMKLTNKFINAITLLLKLELERKSKFRQQFLNMLPESLTQDQVMAESNEVEIITTERVTTQSQDKYSSEQMTVILTLIGVIRLVAKNKHFVSHMLKSLLYREDFFAKKGISMLVRQSDFVKVNSIDVQPLLAEILDSLESMRLTQKQQALQLSTYEGDTDKRKLLLEKQAQLKTLSHNLQLAALDTFIEFSQSLVDAVNNKDGQKSWKISKHAVKSILQILELQIVEQDPLLLSQLSSTLIALFSKSRESWQLILDQCQTKTTQVLTEVNSDLLQIELELLREKKILLKSDSGTPQKGNLEECNDLIEHELLLSRQSSQFSDLVHHDSIQNQETVHLKLDMTQQAKLHNILVDQKEKITGLKHIFQLLNIIYKEILKKNSDSEAKNDKEKLKEAEQKAEAEQNEKIMDQIRDFYQSREMYEHMRLANLALQTLAASNIDLVDHMASNLSCIFGAYMPDLHHMIEESQRNKKRLQVSSEEKITIKPLEFVVQKSKVLSLFKNVDTVSDRLKEFASLCLKNKKAINQYLQLKNRSDFSITDIVNYMPNILSFENKRAYFKKEVQRIQRSAQHDEISLNLRRGQIFPDAYSNLNYRKGDIKGKLRIRFEGEEGIDVGGVTRDFYIELSRQMFNPDYSLFKLCSNGVSHYVAQNSFINPDHLQYLAFAGRMIGKALFDGHYMDCYFAKPLYKMILGEDLTFGDLEDLDNEFYRGLKWMIDEDVENASLVFAVDREFFGKYEEIDLIPNGRNISVTNENKLKYIEHRVHFFLYGMVREQIDAFLTGFHQLIPKELIRVFNYKELELLISGLPNFDLADLKKHTHLDHYTMNDPQIVWFWEVLTAMDSSEIGLFLQFVTGCSKIPLEGFKNLQGMRGVQQFSIKRVRIREDDIMRLPQGHTCYNQLDLPEYPTKELLQERLLFAIKETGVIALA